jgi:hypothetical protein
MAAISNEEFAEWVMLLASPADQYLPTATYDPDCDRIEFLAKPDPVYAERRVFPELIAALLGQSVYTKKRPRMNRSALARRLGIKGSEVNKVLERLRDVARGRHGEYD